MLRAKLYDIKLQEVVGDIADNQQIDGSTGDRWQKLKPTIILKVELYVNINKSF